MPKPMENQFWLTKDKNKWEELREKVEILQENYLLSIEESIKSKFADSEEIKPCPIFITIDNTISESECLKKEQVEPLGKRIIKNLESKR